MAVNINVDEDNQLHKSGHRQIAKLEFSDIVFAIAGIPFTITPSIPVTVGYDLSLSGKATALISAGAEGHFKFGFKGRGHSMHMISQHDFQRSGDLTKLHASAKVGV